MQNRLENECSNSKSLKNPYFSVTWFLLLYLKSCCFLFLRLFFFFLSSSLWWWEGKKKFPGTYVSCSRCKITFSHISTANFRKVPVYLLLWKCTFWLVPVGSNLKEIALCAYLEKLRILSAAICQQNFLGRWIFNF